MSKLKNWRSLSFLLWIVITITMIVTMPNMDKLVKEKGHITIPNTEQSSIADKMIREMDKDGTEKYDVIAVFNSGSKAALTTEQKDEIIKTINALQNEKEQLGIKEVVSHVDNKDLEKQLISKDNTTILTQISVDKKHGEISKIANGLHNKIKPKGVKTYLTGSDLIAGDFLTSSQEGVKKTEVISIIFILVVLIIVFRSPIVPIVSLLTVGVSYLVSMGIIAHLVDQFNFPFSNFTQVFVVVVLFGVGTDYNILLYTRFKEELSKQENAFLATKETFKSAGKTVLYSGIAVLIGFASLALASFKLYQSTSAVAIGVAVLLLVLTTLNPFFMVLLGKGMFYPVKTFKGHEDSRLWGFLAKNSVVRPFAALIIVFVISIPFLMKYSNTLNYNDLFEVDNKYESKKGINVIEEHFPPGFSSPSTLVIQSDNKLDEASSLQTLDELTDKILKVKGVSEVYSPTRPTGERIKELYINKQAGELNTGLGDANGGIKDINDGLTAAKDKMGSKDSNSLANVQKLIDGTNEAKNGVTALGTALHQLSSGINDGAQGAQQIEGGLTSVNENINVLSNATSQLHAGYAQLEKGLSSYDQYFGSISQAIDGAKKGYEQIEVLMTNFIQTKPELANDPNILQTIGIAKEAQKQLGVLSNELNQLATHHKAAMGSFKEANQSLLKVDNGLKEMNNGVTKLQKGAADLKNGLDEGASGSKQIANKSSELQTGLTKINDGQGQLLTGLKDLQEQMRQLQSGLSKSTEGLEKVSNGLGDAQKYLGELNESKSSEKFYIPKEVLEGEDFQKALNTYMSHDRKTAKMTIILDVNPYSKEAMPIIEEINKTIDGTLNGTELKSTKKAIGGTTARNVDLKEVTGQDFLRTATIMLIGIAVVLLVITRSFLNTIFIIGSLILAYFASLGISEQISTHILNVESLSWNVPFFSFIMIVALGVDYSIFVMMRYNELEGDPATKIVNASRHIGGVVLSAALILGGTFAALIPSGVLTLIQVASVVGVALLLLAIIVMPILIPALIGLTNKMKNYTKKLSKRK
ncbi:MMPL family transporter [Bacillus cereus]|uniref:MMPL family transporter n=1 Tax=Bacillus thuringiensis TaxID=1428 RepID=UPI0028533788|nr:MMPL family transporter [Bacillus thuringiensis]MCU5512172.1 MMPL family transporter [Bacillus cereus]MDA2415253.1 MMPL family transporter [Bacillus cereus]MDR4921577.1 MMPL family transporter [Bacillus thuringiensis]MED3580519.1 MMPL family transporter [Bacillus thuringiensis]MED3586931.1 MMPL family transporter [Bacillus thuringiensis]